MQSNPASQWDAHGLSGRRASYDCEVSKWLQRCFNVNIQHQNRGSVHLQCLLSDSDTPQGPRPTHPTDPHVESDHPLQRPCPGWINSQAWVPTIPTGSSTGKALSDVQAQEFTLLTSTMGTLYLGHAGDLQRQQSKVNCREETSGWVTVSKKFSLKSWVLQDEKDSN